jgi:hypothetical protein
VRSVDKSHAAHDSQVVNFNEYLSHMSQLNQAFSMSQQLRDDCNGENHKYIAHQVGILSQSSARVFHSGLKWGALFGVLGPGFRVFRPLSGARYLGFRDQGLGSFDH